MIVIPARFAKASARRAKAGAPVFYYNTIRKTGLRFVVAR